MSTTEEVSSSKNDEPSQRASSISSETSCVASSEDSSTSSSNYTGQNSPSSKMHENSDDEIFEHVQLKSLETEEEELSYERNEFCYTPDRIIKSEFFRILIPSPRFFPSPSKIDTVDARLDDGANEEKNGAVFLAKILKSTEMNEILSQSSLSSRSTCKHCFTVRYGNGEVILPIDNCPQDWNDKTYELPSEKRQYIYSEYNMRYTNNKIRTEAEDNRCNKTKEMQKTTDDSSGISSVDRFARTRADDDWSCSSDELVTTQSKQTSRRVSSELAYVSLEYGAAAAVSEEQNDQKFDINELIATTAAVTKLKINTDRARARFQSTLRPPSPDPEYLARLALAHEPDVRLPSIRVTSTDTETEIKQLRDKIDRLQRNNKFLYKEISLLKKNFATDECKVNHLSEDISKLQTDVFEMKYLDNLIELLEGNLEKISQRKWPFAIKHMNRGIQEINLII